jgi:hypothetical protein
MAELGILEANKRYELIEGIIFELMPIGPKHATKLKKLETQLEACLGDSAVETAEFGNCNMNWWK